MTATATGLFEEFDGADRHRSIDRLAHVVDRQGGNADGGKRFHFDARPPVQCDRRFDPHRRFVDDVELNLRVSSPSE